VQRSSRARSASEVLPIVLLGLVLSACPDLPGDGCAESEACDDTFCGPATARVGDGWPEYRAVQEGETVQITFGSQAGGCGYHIDVGLETEGLCPVVFQRFELLSAGEVVLEGPTEHVQMVREGDDSQQSIWLRRLFIPTERYPNDPEHGDSCPEDAGSLQPLDELEQPSLAVSVEDHGGRSAYSEVPIELACCRD